MLTILPIPAFSDNYLWLLHERDSTTAFVVDPGDATPVEAALRRLQLDLRGILITHHHKDHTGGIEALIEHRNIPVFGPRSAKIPQVTHHLNDGDQLQLPDSNIHFEVLCVPGHTLDHIAYYSAAASVLFCGDTLFAGGCGRMFEGNPKQMHQSLRRLADLPPNTRVYCAHEYTAANLKFAAAVEQDSPEVQARITKINELRSTDTPSVPSLIRDELATNPFLRVNQLTVRSSAEDYTGVKLDQPYDVFAALRRWKDDF